MKPFICLIACLALVSCEQWRAKNAGGTMTIDLPPSKKLVTATWKESHLWYLTRTMRADEQPETTEFHESSNIGILQGTVVFKESR